MGGATGRDHDIDQLTKEVNWFYKSLQKSAIMFLMEGFMDL